MRTLIVYSTKYGCTEDCAKKLSSKLNGKVDLVNLNNKKNFTLSSYDKVIIGGSIYIGKIQKKVSSFVEKNLTVLKNKKIGLFICCMADGDDAKLQLTNSFPKELLDIAVAKEVFGGKYELSKMNFIHRFIIKKVAKTNEDQINIQEDNIDQFASLL